MNITHMAKELIRLTNEYKGISKEITHFKGLLLKHITGDVKRIEVDGGTVTRRDTPVYQYDREIERYEGEIEALQATVKTLKTIAKANGAVTVTDTKTALTVTTN